MNLEGASQLLGLISQVYAQVKPSSALAALWAAALSDIELAPATAAFRVHVRESRYPPTPADLRDILFGRYEREPEYELDLWGRKILGRDGAPRVKAWVERRGVGLFEELEDARKISGSGPLELSS